jgi:EAL domain-containing protein (putative c-di-GMP-specific phosphodiesterase class I)
MAGIHLDVRRVRKAIERDQFRLVYQPKADLRTGSIVGVEALLRWDMPRHGTVSPDEFVPRAERHGAAIQALTQWTLASAFAQARAWQREGRDLTVAVNLSPKSVLDTTLPDQVDSLLETLGLTPALVQLELTETAVFGLADPARVAEVLGGLAAMGVMLALDDFGTGYSSLARLRDLPISTVKIDRSFVSHMSERPQDALIVRSVIALAKSLRLQVVAEGVETERVWRRLADLGCDIAQGNYLTQPLPPGELIPWVQQWEELEAGAHRMSNEPVERRLGPRDRRTGLRERRGLAKGAYGV